MPPPNSVPPPTEERDAGDAAGPIQGRRGLRFLVSSRAAVAQASGLGGRKEVFSSTPVHLQCQCVQSGVGVALHLARCRSRTKTVARPSTSPLGRGAARIPRVLSPNDSRSSPRAGIPPSSPAYARASASASGRTVANELTRTSTEDSTAYENECVQINADLQEKAAPERWKADCLASLSESTAMRKERDSLKRQVDALSDTNATQLDRLTAALLERDDLSNRVVALEAELVNLRRHADSEV
jgi:hypothetical protein